MEYNFAIETFAGFARESRAVCFFWCQRLDSNVNYSR